MSLIWCSELYLADVTGALFISALICGTMLPVSFYTAKILLQVGLAGVSVPCWLLGGCVGPLDGWVLLCNFNN